MALSTRSKGGIPPTHFHVRIDTAFKHIGEMRRLGVRLVEVPLYSKLAAFKPFRGLKTHAQVDIQKSRYVTEIEEADVPEIDGLCVKQLSRYHGKCLRRKRA